MDFTIQCKCQEKGLYRFEVETQLNELDNTIQNIQLNMPKAFQTNCLYKNIDVRIKGFLNNDKLFCWINGITGTGKTYSLYAIRLNQIFKHEMPFEWLDIIKETDFNYKIDYKGFIAIDDIGISLNENRNINLSDLYFSMIDYKVENNEKLILTSNYSYETWIKSMAKVNVMNASRIDSRISGNIDCITLTGADRRKVK